MMLDLSNKEELKKFEVYANKLKDKGAKVELKEKKPIRSINQNSYFHVVISLYAIAYGSTLAETKTDLKRDYGLFYTKNDKKYLKSSADLDSTLMTQFIDWIRDRAVKEMDEYIPTAEEYLTNRFSIDRDIENHKQHIT